jgi:hypothetical protein
MSDHEIHSTDDIPIVVARLQAEVAHQRELIVIRWTALDNTTKQSSDLYKQKFEDIGYRVEKLDAQVIEILQQTSNNNVGANLNALETKVYSELKTLAEKLEAGSKPNYLLGASVLSAAIAAITGIWTVTGLKIDNAISPLVVVQEQAKAVNATQDKSISDIQEYIRELSSAGHTNAAHIEVADNDRKQLNERLRELSTQVNANQEVDRSTLTEIRITLTKISTWLADIQRTPPEEEKK